MSLPVTAIAVEAQLRADADFRGVPAENEVHYLLGMCQARLARANANTERLLTALKALVKAADTGSDAEMNDAISAGESAIYIVENF